MKLLSCPAWRVLLEGKLEKLENRLDAESGMQDKLDTLRERIQE